MNTENKNLNTMCPDCKRYISGACAGTACQTWTGCAYKERVDASKTICKPKLIYQQDAPQEVRYNVQLWHSYDGGKTFCYAGCGRFFSDLYEADTWRKSQRKNLAYDLVFGRMGNGTTVFNAARQVRGDYPNVAHIDDCGAVHWYIAPDKLPPYAVEDINTSARRDMCDFKEKFLKLDHLHALQAVYDAFPMATIANDMSKMTTVEQLYEAYIDFTCGKGKRTMPDV